MFFAKLLCMIGFVACPAQSPNYGSASASVLIEPTPVVQPVEGPQLCEDDGVIVVHQGGTIIDTLNKALEGEVIVWDGFSVVNAETGDLIYDVKDGNATEYRTPSKGTSVKILGSFCNNLI